MESGCSGLSPEGWIALCAIAVSVMAIALAVYEGRLQRLYQRLSATPLLNLMTQYTRGEPITISVKNDGLGPAVVIDIIGIFEGKEFSFTKKYEIADMLFSAELQVYDSKMLTIPGGISISPQSELRLLEFPGFPDGEFAATNDIHNVLVSKLCRLDIKVRYRSLFEEEFETSLVDQSGSQEIQAMLAESR